MIQPAEFRSHEFRNTIHTLLLIGGMLFLLAFLGYLLWGVSGVVGAVVLGGILLLLGQRVSPQFILRMYKAKPLSAQEAPRLFTIVQELTRRAELTNAPQLYYIPSQMMNAFAVGTRDNAVIGVTDGLLRKLTLRELTGVLAHEMSHVRNNDMRVMAFADMISRVTGTFSSVGQFLLLLNLPLILMGMRTISWLAILLLIIAPTISGLLQLALSRTREFDADLDAVRLTGDPIGLANALRKLEYYSANIFQRILMPGHSVPDPSIFRTHPKTNDRVERLMELAGLEQPPPLAEPETMLTFPTHMTRVTRRPGWTVMGLWH